MKAPSSQSWASLPVECQRPPSVVREKNGRAEKVQVELGLADEGTERVEIRRGVQAGDTLLLGQAQGIAPNTPVRVSTVRDAAAAGATPAGAASKN